VEALEAAVKEIGAVVIMLCDQSLVSVPAIDALV